MRTYRYILTFLAVLAGVFAIMPTPARAYTAPSPWLSAPASTTAVAGEIYDYDDQITAEKPRPGPLHENALDWGEPGTADFFLADFCSIRIPYSTLSV